MSSNKLSGARRRKLIREEKVKSNELLKKVPKLDYYFKIAPKSSNTDVIQPHAEYEENEQNNVIASSSTPGTGAWTENSEKKSIVAAINNDVTLGESTKLVPPNYHSQDPAIWVINTELLNYIVKNPFAQNLEKIDFEKSKRLYPNENRNRYASKKMFFVKLVNGENIRREWLLYSASTNKVYCLQCKFFGSNLSQFISGFNDWKHLERIGEHEKSIEHRENTKTYTLRSIVLGKIDSNFEKQYLIEKEYWRNVLKRIINTIKFLSKQGLAFRGTLEKSGEEQCGNYLATLELIAKFDPFLKIHFEKHANKGKGHASYLSKTICDEFIDLLAKSAREKIIEEIESAKYYAISVDSTPDISHTDQLTFILRYVLPNGSVVERFIKFISKVGHKAEDMEVAILKTLDEFSLPIENCVGQSYDNASNMSGEYSGLQARIKKHNAKAVYIPCAAHSLNLIGSCAAESCLQATQFFMFLNELYVFFSSSTARWDILKQTLSESENVEGEARKNLLPKKLSATRWSARADATRALFSCYDSYQNALQNLIDDPHQPPATKVQATGLWAAMNKLETGILLEVWNKLLPKFDSVSKTLQKQSTDVSLVTKLYDSLILYVNSLRSDETFEEIEQNAKDLTKCDTYKLEVNRMRIRKKAFDESKEGETNFNGKQNMKIYIFYVIFDNLSSELTRRKIAYESVSNTFGFMGSLCDLSDNQISTEAANLWQSYQSELDRDFAEECIQFKYFLKALKEENKEENYNTAEILQALRRLKIVATYPNIDTALKIFLTIPATNVTGERSFSTLRRVKNYLRNSLSDSKTSNLALLCIESELVDSLDEDDIISLFISSKLRKKL